MPYDCGERLFAEASNPYLLLPVFWYQRCSHMLNTRSLAHLCSSSCILGHFIDQRLVCAVNGLLIVSCTGKEQHEAASDLFFYSVDRWRAV